MESNAIPFEAPSARAAVPDALDPDPSVAETPSPAATPRRPRTGVVVLSSVLALALIAAGVGAFWMVSQLNDARTRISDQDERISDQEKKIEEQRELIERKDQFGAAMSRLYENVDPLVGLPYSTLIPWTEYQDLANRAWTHRWNADSLDIDVASANALASDLATRSEKARMQASSNASGTAWEATLDALGRGWVSMAVDEGSTACGAEALACVSSADPFVVRVAGNTRTDPRMTDWIRTGVAYHEYAHVLQFTNPEATEPALAAFGGDYETMADCYALTFLDGWTLDHEVPIDASSYWEVSVGYGYTCNEGQRQVIRDWTAGLGIAKQPVGG